MHLFFKSTWTVFLLVLFWTTRYVVCVCKLFILFFWLDLDKEMC